MAYETAITALADPTRRGIFDELRGGPKSVAQLAEGRPVSRPAVSQHLKALMAAKLVSVEPRGTRRIYRLEPTGLADLRQYLDGMWEAAMTSFVEAANKAGEEKRGAPE